MFPDFHLLLDTITSAGHAAELLVLPTNQHAQHDLVNVGPEVEAEKDRLLNVFLNFAKQFSDAVIAAGGRIEGDDDDDSQVYWADYIDPCSGLPMRTLENCTKVYSEVDGMECCLGYRSYNAGFCKILLHPQWGSAVYPATIFVLAPRKIVIELLEQYRVVSSSC